MSTLTDEQLARLAMDAGLPDGSAAYAVAVALAESGGHYGTGDPRAIHKNSNGTIDRGPWQINSVHSQYDPTRLLEDPAYNAKAMADLSNRGQSFHAWSTRSVKDGGNGAADGFIGRGAKAVEAAGGKIPSGGLGLGDVPIIGGTLDNARDTADAVGDFLGTLTSWATWRRVLYVVAGGAAIIAGVAMLASDLAGGVLAPSTPGDEPGGDLKDLAHGTT